MRAATGCFALQLCRGDNHNFCNGMAGHRSVEDQMRVCGTWAQGLAGSRVRNPYYTGKEAGGSGSASGPADIRLQL